MMQPTMVDALPTLAAPSERVGELTKVISHGDFTQFLKDGTELTLSRAYRSQVEAWLRQPI